MKKRIDNLLSLMTIDEKIDCLSTHPEAAVRMSSSSNREGIPGAKWLRSGRTILFIGETLRANPQIYSFDIEKLRRAVR